MKSANRIRNIVIFAAFSGALACSTHGPSGGGSGAHYERYASKVGVTPNLMPKVTPPTVQLIAPITTILNTETPTSTSKVTEDFAPEVRTDVDARGSLTAHIPLWLPPGRRGVQPSLSINYNSNAQLAGGHSLAGYGWSVGGLPKIERCVGHPADSQNSTTTPINFLRSDQLCLDGEPLIPENGTDQLTANAVFRLRHDDHRRFIIGPLDPSQDAIGPTMIVAYGNDGRITVFGHGNTIDGYSPLIQSTASDHTYPNDGVQVTYPTTPNVRYAWLVQSVSDHFGNQIQYQWNKLNCGTADSSPLLQGKGVGAAPSEIDYTSNANSGLSYTKSVTFTTTTGGCAAETGHYVHGMLLYDSAPIKTITVKGPDATGQTNVTLRTYSLTYGNNAATSTLPLFAARDTLVGFQECDGRAICKPSVTFGYQENDNLGAEWTDTSVTGNIQLLYAGPGAPFPPHMYALDLNTDGRDDLMYMQAGTNRYATFVSQGSWPAFTATSVSTGPQVYYDPPAVSRLFPFDYYGRGFPNQLLVSQDNGGVSLDAYDISDSTFFTLMNGSGPTAQPLLDAMQWAEVADLDGDGLQDIVAAATPNGGDPGPGVTIPYLWYSFKNIGGAMAPSKYWLSGYNDHRLLDVDGDGSVELLTPSSNLDPSRYWPVHVGGSIDGTPGVATLTANNTNYVFADINGDGLTDAVQLDDPKGSSGIYIRFNSGHGFFPPTRITSLPAQAWGSLYSARAIDYNHDGRQDILFRAQTGYALSAKQSMWLMWFDGRQMNMTALPGPLSTSIVPVTDPVVAKNQAEMMEVGDFNGDGLDDIAMVNDFVGNGIPAGSIHYFTRGVAATRNRLLTKIDRTGVTRGGTYVHGVETDITYSPISDSTVYSPQIEQVWAFPHVQANGKIWVVKEVKTGDDTNVLPRDTDTTYHYLQGVRDLRGRGFLGFKEIKETQVDRATTIVKDYDLTVNIYKILPNGNSANDPSYYPGEGEPATTTTTTTNTNADGTSNTWTEVVSNPVVAQVTTNGGSYFRYPGKVTTVVSETPSGGVSQQLWQNQQFSIPDINGNETLHSYNRADGSFSTTRHTITYSTGENWPGVVTDVVDDDEKGANGEELKLERTYTYDSWALSTVNALTVASANDRGESPINFSINHDSNGLPTLYTFTNAADGTTRTKQIWYDMFESAFPSFIADSLGHSVQYGFDPGHGLLAISEDEGARQTIYQYDGFGRMRSEKVPSGEYNAYSYVQPSGSLTYPSYPGLTGAEVVITHSSGAIEANEFDFRGNLSVRRRWDRPDGAPTLESFSFNNHNLLQSHWLPTLSPTGGGNNESYVYDNLDRATVWNRADGYAWNYIWQGLTRHDVDVTSGTEDRTITFDNQGRPTNILEWLRIHSGRLSLTQGVETSYQYGPFNSLYSTTDPNGNVTIRQVNRLGELWHTSDPDAGDAYTTYDSYGEIATTQTSLFNTTYSYDPVGRLKGSKTTFTDGSPARSDSFTWDTAVNGLGKLASATSTDNIATSLTYATSGLPQTKTWNVGSESFTITQLYDSIGRLSQIKYPAVTGQSAGPSITYNYDPKYGGLKTIVNTATPQTPYWTWMGASADGLYLTELYGNQITDTATESAAHPPLVSEIQSTRNKGATNAVNLRDNTYSFDQFQTLQTRTDKLGGTSESFGYDSLHRLTSWQWLSGAAVQQNVSYGYDLLGNLLSRSVVAGGTASLSFTLGAKPHQIATDAVGAYSYDTNGRQTQTPARTLTYRELEVPSSATNKATKDTYQFSYDSMQERVLKQHANGDTSITLDDLFERRMVGKQATYLYTVRGPVGPVATLEATTAAPTPVIYYLHRGHQGSIEMVTDANGNVVDRLAYDPFGSRINSAAPETYAGAPASKISLGYDGLAHDDDWLGFINMHGRVYDPAQARFLSVDPMLGKIGSQSLNPYSYVSNDPLSRTDLTGFEDDGGDAATPPPMPVHPYDHQHGEPYVSTVYAHPPKPTGITTPSPTPGHGGAQGGGQPGAGPQTGVGPTPPPPPPPPSTPPPQDVTASVKPTSDARTFNNACAACQSGTTPSGAPQRVIHDAAIHSEDPIMEVIMWTMGPETKLLPALVRRVAGGRTAVYILEKEGKVVYYGITSWPKARAAYHLLTKQANLRMIQGLEDLTRMEARQVEEVLIKRGFDLRRPILNKIHSIATSRAGYQKMLQAGEKLIMERAPWLLK